MSYNDDNNYAGFKIGYKYKIGSKEYVDMVYKQYNLIPYEYMKPEKISDYNNPYVIQATELYNKIKSGKFMYEKNSTYKQNYIQMMENMGIPEDIIKIVREMNLKKFIGASDMMPYMKDYYDYLKGRHKARGKYSSPADAINDFYQNLKSTLKDMGYNV